MWSERGPRSPLQAPPQPQLRADDSPRPPALQEAPSKQTFSRQSQPQTQAEVHVHHTFQIFHFLSILCSSLIRNYSKFCSGVSKQRPDRILRHAPPPPRPSQRHALAAWWVWLASWGWSSKSLLRTVLSVVGPVLIAMAIYLYVNPSSVSTSPAIHTM